VQAIAQEAALVRMLGRVGKPVDALEVAGDQRPDAVGQTLPGFRIPGLLA